MDDSISNLKWKKIGSLEQINLIIYEISTTCCHNNELSYDSYMISNNIHNHESIVSLVQIFWVFLFIKIHSNSYSNSFNIHQDFKCCGEQIIHNFNNGIFDLDNIRDLDYQYSYLLLYLGICEWWLIQGRITKAITCLYDTKINLEHKIIKSIQKLNINSSSNNLFQYSYCMESPWYQFPIACLSIDMYNHNNELNTSTNSNHTKVLCCLWKSTIRELSLTRLR